MQPQYRKKQRVRIISVKHTKKEEYLNQTGVIIDSMFAGKWGQMDYLSHSPGDYYVYKVRLDKNNTVVMVVEEELESI
jgi:hypothetical protein